MSARDLATIVSKEVERRVQSAKDDHQLGVITRLKPLTVDPIGLDYVLHDDDIVLSQWVRAYDENTGLKVEDNLVLHLTSGTWVAVDVVGDTRRALKIHKNAGGGGGNKPEPETPAEEQEIEEETEEEEAEEEESGGGSGVLDLLKESGVGFVNHGGDPSVPRNEAFAMNIFEGTVAPTHAAVHKDLWVKPE